MRRTIQRSFTNPSTNAMGLGEHCLRLRDVTQEGMQDNDIKARVLEAQSPPIANFEDQVRHAGAEAPGLVDEMRRWVHSDDLPDVGPGCKDTRDGPRATANLQNLRPVREIDISQICPDHLLLLGDRRSQFQDVGDHLQRLGWSRRYVCE
jgi:hypothetical protein